MSRKLCRSTICCRGRRILSPRFIYPSVQIFFIKASRGGADCVLERRLGEVRAPSMSSVSGASQGEVVPAHKRREWLYCISFVILFYSRFYSSFVAVIVVVFRSHFFVFFTCATLSQLLWKLAVNMENWCKVLLRKGQRTMRRTWKDFRREGLSWFFGCHSYKCEMMVYSITTAKLTLLLQIRHSGLYIYNCKTTTAPLSVLYSQKLTTRCDAAPHSSCYFVKSASVWWLKLVTAVLNSEGIHVYKWWWQSEASLINPCNDVEAGAAMVLEGRRKERVIQKDEERWRNKGGN